MERNGSVSLKYPLQFKFQIGTLAIDFLATDALGQQLFYIRKKMLTWQDTIKVYADRTESNLLYQFVSNTPIDFQQTFALHDPTGRVLGKIRRKSLRSLWRSTFYLMDKNDVHDHSVKEKNPWTTMWDGIFGEIPIIGMLSGYIFNPVYALCNIAGEKLFESEKSHHLLDGNFPYTSSRKYQWMMSVCC